MKRLRLCLLVVGVLILGVVCSDFVAAQGGSWVTATRRAGIVESCLSNSQTWLRVTSSRRLGLNDSIKTATDGACSLRLADNSLLAMGPNTQTRVREFAFGGSRRNVNVQVDYGKLRTQTSKFRGRSSDFQISTPNAVMAAQGTDFLVDVNNPDTANPSQATTIVTVFSGSISLQDNSGRTVNVPEGHVGVVAADNRPQLDPPNAPSYADIVTETQSIPGIGEMTTGHQEISPISADGGTVGNHFGPETIGNTPATTDSGTPADPALPIAIPPTDVPTHPTGTVVIPVHPYPVHP